MKFELLNPEDKTWIDFLKREEHFVFHRPEYLKFIESTFKNTKGYYIGIKENNKLKSIHPFFHLQKNGIKKILSKFSKELFDEKIMSAAFNDYGGNAGGNIKSLIARRCAKGAPKCGCDVRCKGKRHRRRETKNLRPAAKDPDNNKRHDEKTQNQRMFFKKVEDVGL